MTRGKPPLSAPSTTPTCVTSSSTSTGNLQEATLDEEPPQPRPRGDGPRRGLAALDQEQPGRGLVHRAGIDRAEHVGDQRATVALVDRLERVEARLREVHDGLALRGDDVVKPPAVQYERVCPQEQERAGL